MNFHAKTWRLKISQNHWFSPKNSKSQFFDIIEDLFFSLFRSLQCCKMGKMRLFRGDFEHYVNFPICSRYVLFILTISQCWKITQNVAYKFFNLGISINFCPIKSDLSGNTVWLPSSGCQNLAKLTIFGIFYELKCKRSFARNVKCDLFHYFQTPFKWSKWLKMDAYCEVRNAFCEHIQPYLV